MKRLLSIIAVSLVLVISCKKGQTGEEVRDVPSEVTTSDIQSPDPTRLILKGSIKKGSKTITEYGFIYGKAAGLTNKNGTRVSLGTGFEGGDFVKEIKGLIPNTDNKSVIYARAYFIDESGIFYGNEISTEPSVFGPGILSPSFGKTEDQILIKGKFYSPVKTDIAVTFGDVQTEVLSVSDTEIIVKVPKGIPAAQGEKVTVNLVNRGIKTEVTKNFEILAHIIDFSPKEGGIGSYIFLSGDNLPKKILPSDELSVYFDNIEGQTGAYPTFNAQVPFRVSTEKIPVYVSIKGSKIKLPGEFTALKPLITDISPKSGPPGTQFTVTGLNLPYIGTSSPFLSGKLGSKTVDVFEYSTSLLHFISTVDAAPGEQAFTLLAGGFSVVADQKVNMLPHQITDVQPRSGYITDNFVITGTFVYGNSYKVYLNNQLYKEVLAGLRSDLLVGIEKNLEEGDVEISVVAGTTKISGGKFKVLHPRIASISPANGKIGTKVVLQGEGNSFNFTSELPNVYLGDIKIRPTRNESNQIYFMVPENAKPGKQKIRLDYSSYDLISPELFEVLE